MTIIERLSEVIIEVIKNYNLSNAKMAKKLNWNINAVDQHRRMARKPDALFIEIFCKAYGVNPSWIISGKPPRYTKQAVLIEDRLKFPEEQQPEKGVGGLKTSLFAVQGPPVIPKWEKPVQQELFDFVPMAEARLSAGGGSFVLSEASKEHYPFRRDWLQKVATAVRNLVIMRVVGNSMDPTIMDGDIIMLDRGRPGIFTGQIYALGIDDNISIKRLELMAGTNVRIISDNKSQYPAYEIDRVTIRILGQIIWFARQMIRSD